MCISWNLSENFIQITQSFFVKKRSPRESINKCVFYSKTFEVNLFFSGYLQHNLSGHDTGGHQFQIGHPHGRPAPARTELHRSSLQRSLKYTSTCSFVPLAFFSRIRSRLFSNGNLVQLIGEWKNGVEQFGRTLLVLPCLFSKDWVQPFLLKQIGSKISYLLDEKIKRKLTLPH